MMTEEEAKKRWCPFAREIDFRNDQVAAEEYPSPIAATNTGSTCIAYECMAWRWVADKKRGFCGLAGGGTF